MQQKDRGCQTCQTNGVELRVIRWFNNRAVTVLTRCEAIQQPCTKVKQWD